jgi:tetratricopeptide (TPR) repeat protein
LDIEHDNLRTAMAYLRGTARHEQSLRFGIALRWFWYARGYWGEGSELLGAALELPGAHAPRELRSAALCAAGHLCARRADFIAAQRHLEEGLEIARALGDPALTADNLSGLAWVAYKLGRQASATPLMNEAVDYARQAGGAQLIGRILERRASVSFDDPAACRADFAEALTYLQAAQDRFGIGIVENNLGDLELLDGHPEVARQYLDNAVAISKELNDESVVYTFLNLGHVDLAAGDIEPARSWYTQALTGARKTGDQSIVATAILGFALCETASGHDEDAAVLHGAADASLEQVGEVLEPVEGGLRERDHERLRASMGDAAFEAGYNAGRRLSVADAVEMTTGGRASR